jgi:hypothetical protein
MRASRVVIVLALVALVPCAVNAAEAEREFGVGIAGLTHIFGGGSSGTALGVPNPVTTVTPTVYATFFTDSRLAFEPQLGFAFLTSDGSSMHTLSLAGQVDYLLKESVKKTPYVFGRAWLVNAGGDGDSATRFALGAGAGYRYLLGGRGVIRPELRFDHMFPKNGSSSNFLTAAVSMGLTF